tara:strand:+ start:1723 stop:1947 length:225 start_codon:yes stop_codon:yes gene_type:complete
LQGEFDISQPTSAYGLGSLKHEAAFLHGLQDGFPAERIIDSWIEFHDAGRPHIALEKQPSDNAYFDPVQLNQAA